MYETIRSFFREAECEAFRRSGQLEFSKADVDEGCQKLNSKNKEKAPINRGLLCAVTSACLVYPAASLILAASLPHGCSYLGALAVSFLLLPHGSCLFKPSAASWISQIQGFVSWFLFL